MGLERIRAVYDRLQVRPACPVITVAGTNGKGSTCAMLERMLRAGAYHVGLYTSPHLLRYNERVRIDGVEASDAELCDAFAAVEAVRKQTPLTYFEFGTLAALWLFARARPSALVLEVGLGGRLDAVNLIDADASIVTTVAIDHVDYLGTSREDIGREKAGVFRQGRAAICVDPAPPATLVDHAQDIGARLLRLGVDFGFNAQGGQWRYWGPNGARYGLPYPALRGSYQLANAAGAIAALDAVRDALPVSMNALREGLVSVELPGRFQVLPGRPTRVLDVAHNAQAAQALAGNLGGMGFYRESFAVLGMMRDKDIDRVIAALRPRVDRWHVATLPTPRSASATLLRSRLEAAGISPAHIRDFDEPAAAYQAACGEASENDRIIVFGSFLTVAAALAQERRPH